MGGLRLWGMGWLFPFLVSNNQREIVNLIRVLVSILFVIVSALLDTLPYVNISNFRTSSTKLGVSENLAY